VAPERIVTIPNGFNPAEFEKDPMDLRQECGISPLTPWLGFVGNIRPVKGFDILVKAVKLLESTPFQVVVIGRDPGGEAERMVREVGLASRVKFLGPRPRAFRWMRSMDVVVMSSRSEGLGKTAIEAMSLQRVVIASKVGGLVEFIDDGTDGFLVPPESPPALAEAIKRVVSDADLRQKIGARARYKIESQFSFEATADCAYRLYQELLTPAPTRTP
jgi:glycosyltransferase involved in cell wall biosynthesis